MSSGNFHAIFDSETYREFVCIVGKGNVRKTFEDYMMTVISTNNMDSSDVNIKIIDLKIEDRIVQNRAISRILYKENLLKWLYVDIFLFDIISDNGYI